MWIWNRVSFLEARLKRLEKKVRDLYTKEEPEYEVVEAIGFKYEPDEYDEWEYEDEPY